MKNLVLVGLILALFSFNVKAAGINKIADNAVEANDVTTRQFANDFTGATEVKWSKNKYLQQVDFVFNGDPASAFYNYNGEFLGLIYNLDFKTLPAKAMKQIEKNYKGYTLNKVILLQAPENMSGDADQVAYFADLKKNNSEVLVRITPQANVELFQQIR